MTTNTLGRSIGGILVACMLFFAAAGSVYASQDEYISMDFKKVDIHVLIKFISELTGKNFIVDNRVGGRVTIYSPSKVNAQEAYRVFESVLQVNNFTIVPSGTAYKIVPMAVGRSEGVPALPTSKSLKQHRPEGDELVTLLIPLQHSSALELGKILPKLVGKNGLVTVYPPTNSLIITAPYARIQQAKKIIREIDKAQYAPQFSRFLLRYGDAKSVAANLNDMLRTKVSEQAKFGKKSLALVQADERTNVVLVLADPETLLIVKKMVATLDIPTPAGKGDIHFISLENAKAEDVAKVVNTLVEHQGKNKEEKILSRGVKIVADNATNSLVITARPDDFLVLKETIEKLDVERKQVFIEALIMEASSDSNFSFGVNWAAGQEAGKVFLFGSSNQGGGTVTLPATSKSGFPTFPAGGSFGAIIQDAFSIGGTKYSIQSILSAVKGDNNYTILATPQLLTLDNEEARVSVVDNVPFVKETVVTTANSINTQSVDYKDVGVKLKITPRIGQNQTLQLEVLQEVSRVISSLVAVGKGQNLVAPTTRKREVETTIRMKDGQTAVIAGLLSEDGSKNNSKTPGLGDIPLLGWLFKQKNKTSAKSNLYIFITPHIINSFDEAAKLAQEKRHSVHVSRVGKDGLGLPIMSKPYVFPATVVE